MSLIGEPLSRTDARLKVTGAAKYAAEYPQPKLAYAALVTSTIANGSIASIDAREAASMPGVLLVMTNSNAPRLPPGVHGRVLTLLQDNRVRYQNQPIGVVVADTFERAVDAARHVRVTYRQEVPRADFAREKVNARETASTLRGDVDAGLAAAGATRIEAIYTTPIEHHNPMEPHATTAVWQGDYLTLYDATQGVTNDQQAVAATLGIPADHVRVICPFVGGGFGCKGSTWSHVVLAAMAARQAGRPVKLVLDRQQMFGPIGARPMTEQHFRVAAREDGTLTGMRHDVVSTTSTFEDWTEQSSVSTRMLYRVPNLSTSQRIVPLSIGTPTFTRAPGEASGNFVTESAMDELAYALRMDPVELRLKNYAEVDPQDGKPWSSKLLRACYTQAAERFGWAHRNPQPRSMRDGVTLIGMGMATATYPANRRGAKALARILPDGTALVESGTQDLGTGTYTVMTQVAADALGFPLARVHFVLGDTDLPVAPGSGGSASVASVSPAVRAACVGAREKLIATALADPASPLHGAPPERVTVENGWLTHRDDARRRDPAAAVIARAGGEPIEASAQAAPGPERGSHSFHSFGAVFAQVGVDDTLGIVRVQRIVATYDVGQLLNAKTGRSQLMGGIVWGISQALLEDSQLDSRYGRFVNGNLADYHVPVNADVRDIDVTVLGEADPFINDLGARGIGEIGITGVAAAIANAVYHASGVRVRDLPITADKLMV